MNPGCGLLSARHQRSPSDYIDSHTTQTVTPHPGLHFPCSIALIAVSPEGNHTHFKYKALTTIQGRVLFVFLPLLEVAFHGASILSEFCLVPSSLL